MSKLRTNILATIQLANWRKNKQAETINAMKVKLLNRGHAIHKPEVVANKLLERMIREEINPIMGKRIERHYIQPFMKEHIQKMEEMTILASGEEIEMLDIPYRNINDMKSQYKNAMHSMRTAEEILPVALGLIQAHKT
ncbi:hypothetical protein [Prochlorococcus marinus]|uniref:hypothetical protein n=1 Tax=Prochlorococcus sp. MIT 1313 TaxID=3082538 RepID=UPI0007B35041